MKRLLVLALLLPTLAYAQGKMTGHGAATGNGGLQLNAHISITGFTITPADQQQNLGGLIGYTATLTLSNGDHYVVTRFATWTSNNNSIADPITDPSSFFTVETYQCESPGTIEVKAVYGNQTATTHLTCNGTVPPPPTPVSLAISPLAPSINVGRTQGFTAKETYSDGSVQDVTAAAAWSTSDATIASKGTLGTQQPFTCLKGGAITVTATNDSLTPATTTLTCNAVLTSISIQPATAQILVGGNQTFKATGLYNDGSSQDVTSQATWSSGTPSVAALAGAATGVNPQIFNGIAPGSATLTAAVGTINNTATITVTSSGPPPPTLVSIQVTPANKTINVGSRLNFIATCTYSDGSTAPCSAAPTVWTTGNAAIAALGITDGFVGGAYSYTLTGTGSTPWTWTVPSAASSGMVDIVDWAAMPLPDRNNFHLTGDDIKYFRVQAGFIDWIKGGSGHPWDLESFDGNAIHQDCTEGPTFSNANGYKCYINPPALWPRYCALVGCNVTIDTPGPNFYNITESCGTDHLPAINNQDIRGNLSGSFNDITWQTTYGGNIPDNTPYFLFTKYINGVSGVYQNREQYWGVQGYGQVRWCPATWNGSGYTLGTCKTNTNKVAGGAPALNFGCGIPNPGASGSLPPGTVQTSGPSLNLVDSTGVIAGTPTIAGSYPVTIQQEDGTGAFHLQSQTIRVAATASQVQQTVLGISAGGPVVITATLGSIHGNTNITVQTPTPTIVSIAVTPNPATVLVNGTLGFHALATLSDGTTQDVSASATWASATPSVAVLLAAGNPQNIKCVSAGASNITAQVGAVTSPGDTLTCQNPTPPSFGMDAYCGAGNVPSFGTNDSYAEMPTTCYFTNPSVFLSPGTVRHATDATTLNSAITATACGDVISVDADFQGQFTVPSLHCDASHYVTIKGFGLASLPAYGTAVSPCYANVTSLAGYVNSDGSSIFSGSGCGAHMPTITSTVASGTGAVWKVPAGGFSYLIIEGIVHSRLANGNLATDLCLDTTTGGQWDHFIFYHNWAKGTTTDETNRCMVLNRGTYAAIINNFGSEFHCLSGSTGQCTDAKFIGGGTNTHAGDTDNTWKIKGNVAASAAQGVLFGGGAAAIIPTDAEIGRNWWFKPPSWNPACTVLLCGAAYNGGGPGGIPWIVKNCEENKTGIRFFYEANKCQNGWGGFTQVGNAITLTPKNQSGTLCPICDVHDITHRYEVIESYWQGMQIANVSDGNGTYAAGGHNYSLHDINQIHMMYKACYQCQQSAAEMTLFNAIPATDILHDVDVNHISFVPDATGTFFSSYLLGADAARSPSSNFNIKWQNSIWMAGFFGGFHSSSGSNLSCASSPFPTGLAGDAVGIMANCWSSPIVTGNAIVPALILRPNSASKWPAGTCVLAGTGLAAFNALYTNYNNGAAIGGNYAINPSSPCHNTANDGTDPGANQATLANRMQGVTTF